MTHAVDGSHVQSTQGGGIRKIMGCMELLLHLTCLSIGQGQNCSRGRPSLPRQGTAQLL